MAKDKQPKDKTGKTPVVGLVGGDKGSGRSLKIGKLHINSPKGLREQKRYGQ